MGGGAGDEPAARHRDADGALARKSAVVTTSSPSAVAGPQRWVSSDTRHASRNVRVSAPGGLPQQLNRTAPSSVIRTWLIIIVRERRGAMADRVNASAPPASTARATYARMVMLTGGLLLLHAYVDVGRMRPSCVLGAELIIWGRISTVAPRSTDTMRVLID